MVKHVVNQKKMVLKITQMNSVVKSNLQNPVDEKSINSQNSIKLYKLCYVFSVNFLPSTMWQPLTTINHPWKFCNYIMITLWLLEASSFHVNGFKVCFMQK
jgi:hypothetical protein